MLMTNKSNTPKPKPKFKKKRKKKSKIYFGTPVQNAVIRYNECKNPAIKNKIYKEHIQFAFNKLASSSKVRMVLLILQLVII